MAPRSKAVVKPVPPAAAPPAAAKGPSSAAGYEAYDALAGLRWTVAKTMRASPRHYAFRLANPSDDTTGRALGRADHTAVFEPDRFLLDYVLWQGDRRAGKAWEAFEAAHAGRTILKVAEYTKCLAVRDAVRGHPVAGKTLARGKAEQVIQWVDAATGIHCKCKMDWLDPESALYDLKGVPSLEPSLLAATVARAGYHGQMAYYRRGIKAALGVDLPAKLICVEVTAPHDVGVVALDAEALDAGDAMVADILAKVAECTASNTWPGRCAAETTLSLPKWAMGAGADKWGIIVDGVEI